MTEPELSARVRRRVYDHFVEHAVPPTVEQLMSDFSLSRETAEDVLARLDAERQLALLKGTYRILMAWPFSAIATPFSVEVGGRRYYANCAWDAIGFHAMLRQDVRVASFCHHCATPISIDLRGGRAFRTDPPEALVFLALPAARWWDDIITTCSNTMVFFASPEHRDASAFCEPGGAGASLTPDQAYTLSVPVYGNRLAMDYARPSRQALLDHFAAMGLSGDFWRL